jgi:hypothetical protein
MLTERDKQIVEFITDFRMVKRDHLVSLFFHNHQSKIVCNRRMKQILKHSSIKRTWAPDEWQSVYYVGAHTDKPKHNFRLVELYLWLKSNLGDGEVLSFDREAQRTFTFAGQDYRMQTDAIVVITNQSGAKRRYLVEIDNDSESQRQFDKPKIYHAYRESKAYHHETWSWARDGGHRFAPVIIVAYTKKRVESIKSWIAKYAQTIPAEEMPVMHVVLWDDIKDRSDFGIQRERP